MEQGRSTRWQLMAAHVALASLVLADAVVLVALHPAPPSLARHLAAPTRWVRDDGADRAAAQLAGAALWCVALWCAVGLLAVLLHAGPGSAGLLGRRLTRLLVPRAVHRVLAAAIGFGVLAAPAMAGAASRPAASAVEASGPALPAPIWPSTPGLATPTWPTSPTTAPVAPASPTNSTVVVKPGDSLWLIAAARLRPRAGDAAIAAACSEWYASNRAVIGPDPDLITPGLVLRAPAPTEAS
jgi:hypothetical protein